MKRLLSSLALVFSCCISNAQLNIDSLINVKYKIENAVNFDANKYLEVFFGLYNHYVEVGDYSSASNLVHRTFQMYIDKQIYHNTPYTRAVYVTWVKLIGLMENYDLALQYAEKAESMFIDAHDTLNNSYAGLLSNISGYYRLLRDTINANKTAIKSIEVCKNIYGNNVFDDIDLINKHELHGMTNNIGLSFFYSHNYQTAEYYFKKVIESLKNNPSHEVYQTACSNLAILYSNQNRLKESIALIEKAIPYTQNSYMLIHFYEQIITDYTTLKDTNNVENYLIRYDVANLNNLLYHFTHFSDLERDGRWQRIAYQTLWFNNLTSSCICTPITRRIAFEINAYYKYFTLFYAKIIYDYIKQSNDNRLKEMYYSYRNDKNKYVFEHNSRDTYFNSLSKELNIINYIKDSIQNILGEKLQYYNDIYNYIDKEEYIIQFCDIDDIAHARPDPNQTYYTAYIIGKAFSYPIYYYVCTKPQTYVFFPSDNTDAKLFYNELYSSNNATELYRILFEPLEYFLKNAKTIYYVTSGQLANINFDNMVDFTGIPLNEKYKMVRVSSIYEIPQVKARDLQNLSSAALYGNINYDTSFYDSSRGSTFGRLKNAGKEINSISNILKGQNIAFSIFDRTSATEESFKNLSGKSPEILHLATHGFCFETDEKAADKPFAQNVNSYSQKESAMVLSGLALSGANNIWKGNFDLPNAEDGILTAYEISQLDLSNTRLAVLSACETARGRIFPVDGVFGLQRAFKQAGAGSILMSLWKVDDAATALFMEHFYKFLFETHDRHAALKMAQSEVKKQHPDPYYWAAWVMLD